jgi:hypothetical protein
MLGPLTFGMLVTQEAFLFGRGHELAVNKERR